MTAPTNENILYTFTTNENILCTFFPYYVLGSMREKADNTSFSGNNEITVQVTAKKWIVTFGSGVSDKKTTLRGDVLGTLELEENER
jgi:hypothetical protein